MPRTRRGSVRRTNCKEQEALASRSDGSKLIPLISRNQSLLFGRIMYLLIGRDNARR